MKMDNEVNNIRRIDGPTPSGGAYAILYFYDENDNPVVEENASKAYGVEFDNEGKTMKTTYFNIRSSNEVEGENRMKFFLHKIIQRKK